MGRFWCCEKMGLWKIGGKFFQHDNGLDDMIIDLVTFFVSERTPSNFKIIELTLPTKVLV